MLVYFKFDQLRLTVQLKLSQYLEKPLREIGSRDQNLSHMISFALKPRS